MRWAKTFLQPDTRPGMLMLLAAILALLAANSPLSPLYDAIKGTPVSIVTSARSTMPSRARQDRCLRHRQAAVALDQRRPDGPLLLSGGT